MQIIFSANEIQASHAMAKTLVNELGTHFCESDPYVALRKEQFVTVRDDGSVLFEVPEEFVVEYTELASRYNRQLIQIGKTIFSILQTVKSLFGDFEKDLSKLLKKFSKPVATSAAVE